MNNLFSSILTFFHGMADGAVQPAIDAGEQFIKQFAGDAAAIVADQVGKYATGKEAFDVAVKELGTRVAAAGWTDFQAGVHMLIESAYAGLKTKNGDPIAKPPVS